MPDQRPLTVVHVTHEATEKLGGIGAVLEGLIANQTYQRAVGRSILVAPLFKREPGVDPLDRLGEGATKVHYSSIDHIDAVGFGAVLRPIEWAFGTPLVYGRRTLAMEVDHGATGEAEVLLVDVSNPDLRRLAEFKHALYEKFGIHAHRYERSWDFEEYCRLAWPAWHALMALIPASEFPGALISHEYMGMCTALAAAMDPQRRLRTIFHAHECSTARSLVERLPGHDLAFYPAMHRALDSGRHLAAVFGDQSDNPRHALVSQVHRLDLTLAVGEETAAEMRFLGRQSERARTQVCFNGVPSEPLTMVDVERSRKLVFDWIERAYGFRPDYLFTHVTRPVISKGLWRDLRVMSQMEQALKRDGKRAMYLLVTSAGRVRTPEEIARMRERYRWPRAHHEGWPDLVGPEIHLWHDIEVFNNPGRAGAGAIVGAMVNQFGFTRERLGADAPADITIADLRRAADVEFGQSTYEPFGIAQLEPLHCGAICVPSAVCGCVGFAQREIRALGMDPAQTPNLLVADYVNAFDPPADAALLTREQRDAVETRVAGAIAAQLLPRLARTPDDRRRLLDAGQAIAARMNWTRVCEDMFIPALRSVVGERSPA